jgi:hypothetical protein
MTTMAQRFMATPPPVDFSFCLVFIFGRLAWRSTGSQAQIELAIHRTVHCNKSRCSAA